MMVNLSIIPECFADTNLIETITNSHNCYNHQKSCGKVAITMKSPALTDSFAVGIIDKDKKEISYLNEFEKVVSSEDLYLYKHPKKHHYIIQISPAIEKFVLKSAEEVGINLEDFGLPNEFEHLKKITKRITSRDNIQLRNLFFELKNKNASQIVLLSNWILYLKEKTYEAKIEDLTRI